MSLAETGRPLHVSLVAIPEAAISTLVDVRAFYSDSQVSH